MNWVSTSVRPGTYAEPPSLREVEWRSATLPARGHDDDDHWFRTRVTAPGESILRFGGLATVCEVFVDGERVLRSESMFLAHDLPIGPGDHEIVVCARALTPLLGVARKPRARWRSRVPVDGNLRWFRTSLLGRAPGFSPGPPIVGPWRPVTLVDPTSPQVEVRTFLNGRDGVVTVRSAESAGDLEVTIGGLVERLPAGGGTVRVVAPSLWWPHTHGEPVLHEVQIRADAGEVRQKVGFRTITHAADLEHGGLDLHVNDVAVFARGAVWTPTPPGEVRATLERARDAGLNMVRIVGSMVYEDATFHDACDELGLLVWQDLMFANMDYPFVDEAFAALVEEELRQSLREVAGRPSLAVVCGNSEVEQQVAMLGLPFDLGRQEFFYSRVPELLRAAEIEVPYLPSAPTGGTRPFRADRGVANYFGVGAYLRDLGDVRRAGVLFASECLAFANVPDDDPPDRSTGVMRDVGAGWDFADVRDHYLGILYGVAPEAPGYWDCARNVTGELMSFVFGEWRRAGSPCSGGLILWLRDLAPGAGWGLLDSDGRPKAAWFHVRRALAPIAVWFVEEGLNGLAVQVANDRASTLHTTLRLALYRDERLLVEEVETPLIIGPHSAIEHDAEELLGRFVDIGYTYRFGEMQHDTVVATLLQDGAELSKAFYSLGRDARRDRVSADELGLRVKAVSMAEGAFEVRLGATRVVHGLRLRAPGFEPDDDSFDLEPARERRVVIRALTAGSRPSAVRVSAIELGDEFEVPVA